MCIISQSTKHQSSVTRPVWSSDDKFYLQTICKIRRIVKNMFVFLKRRFLKHTSHNAQTALLSVCLSIYLSIYGSTALCWTLAAFSVSWSYTQSVGLLGRGISLSQGRYLHAQQHKHRINAYKHQCLKRDSNPRSQCMSGRRQFMSQTARPLWPATALLSTEIIGMSPLGTWGLCSALVNEPFNKTS
jgi:hypothetical protein